MSIKQCLAGRVKAEADRDDRSLAATLASTDDLDREVSCESGKLFPNTDWAGSL